MAWCPNCKNEYREGVEVCPDCEIELVDELPEEDDEESFEPKPVILMSVADEETGGKIVRYLHYNGIMSGVLGKTDTAAAEPSDEDEDEDLTADAEETEQADDKALVVIVADVELEAAKELFPGLGEDETVDEDRLYELVPDIEDQFEEIENEQASKEFSELRSEASTVYVKKKDKYADLRFSGFSFIGFGIIGVIILVLNVLHVINLFNVYSMIVMGIVFIVFFIIGFATLRRASLVKDSVAVEDEFTEQLDGWIRTHLSDDVIDEWYDETKEDQENYFEIQDRIIRMMKEEFPNIHPSYIEELAEERYNSYLERSAYESPDDIPEADEPDETDDETDEESDGYYDDVDDEERLTDAMAEED